MSEAPDNLIDDYLKYTSVHEGSRRIHLWSIISVIAAALERRVYVNHGYYKIFPNLYVFIVGQSGLLRKSTSTGMAVELLREMPNIKIMADRVTAGSLIDAFLGARKEVMGEVQAPMFIYASELIVFVKEVFGTITELLTTFYDCPNEWVYKTKHQGTTALKKVCLNMLAATTIEWLREGVTERIMGAGFAGRIIFVCEKSFAKEWNHWPTQPSGTEEIKIKLTEKLLEIYDMAGEMIPSEEFLKEFKRWYQFHMNEIAVPNKSPKLSGYYARKHAFLLKLSMVRSAAVRRNYRLELEDLMWATNVLDDVEQDLHIVYQTPIMNEKNRIRLLEEANNSFREA